jgi:hypothetical protein
MKMDEDLHLSGNAWISVAQENRGFANTAGIEVQYGGR